MGTFIAIAWVIFLLVFAIVKSCKFSRQGNNKNIAKETALSLGAKCNSLGRYVINKNGIKYWFQYTPSTKNSPPILTVSVPCLSHGEFMVVPEGKFDKLAKKIGFSSELQTGDVDFDNSYYILSDTVDFARVYFQSEQKRNIIKHLYSTGFSQVKHNGRSIVVSWVGFNKTHLSDSLITETIASLVKLSENLPDYFANQEFLGIPRLRIKTVMFYLFSSLVLVAALVAYSWTFAYPPLDESKVFRLGLLFSVPAAVLYLIAAGLGIRGRAAAHKDFIWIAVISLLASIIFTNNTLLLVNGVGDKNEPVCHTVAVVRQFSTVSKNTTTYHVDVGSWRPGHNTEHFTVDRDTYKNIQLGKTEAIIVTKPGALGFEWLVSKRFNYKAAARK
ncbi:MAG: hypothetical protein NT014_06440 [Candidatus Omnitrophica bacterium]|nr:hypothetical protein [Candidatus Omnitrophota bacterium]